jgi:hypothetical protein
MKQRGTATAQMCQSKAEARREAKKELELLFRANQLGTPKNLRYKDWTQRVGDFTFYYCTATGDSE